MHDRDVHVGMSFDRLPVEDSVMHGMLVAAEVRCVADSCDVHGFCCDALLLSLILVVQPAPTDDAAARYRYSTQASIVSVSGDDTRPGSSGRKLCEIMEPDIHMACALLWSTGGSGVETMPQAIQCRVYSHENWLVPPMKYTLRRSVLSAQKRKHTPAAWHV